MKVYNVHNYTLLKAHGISTRMADKAGIEVFDVYVGKSCGFAQYRKGIARTDLPALKAFAEEQKPKVKRTLAPERKLAAEKRKTEKAEQERQDWVTWCQSRITNPDILELAISRHTGAMYDLITQLDDVNVAHPSWLAEAHRALIASIRHKGIYRDYKRGIYEGDFYSMVCKALNAYRRHTYTDYDDIDKRGLEDFEISELRKVKTIEAKER